MANADRLIELFNEALAKPAGADRERFLVEHCGTDADLREQVVSLLEAAILEHESGFLRQSPLIGHRPQGAERPGDRIGPYTLIEPLGEGGCGVVYLAGQETPLRRQVALKVIKLGMDTRRVVARFEAERQTLALMEHPNIARVIDAGATSAGRPYFVMELVRGIRITDYCDRHRLTTDQRLRLFVQVCLAVQHAHQKGIIHRDLKPSNILVVERDGVAVPKVIDFGVAKATGDHALTDGTAFTGIEPLIGTPAYMSPEQAERGGLDLDTRSDIYALGVLLYELMTGHPPFESGQLLTVGWDEMRRTIRECDPPRPSTRLGTLGAAELSTVAGRHHAEPAFLIRLLRGDLDWIVMKALEKDRSRRYSTANDLAADVQRFLRKEPVVARPPGKLYRLGKLVRRNRLMFAATGSIVATVVVALVVLVVSNHRIRRESEARVAALENSRENEQLAKERLFIALQSQAQARRISRQPGQRIGSLAALAEAARIRPDPGLRDHAIAALALPDVRPGPGWHVARTNCAALACDPVARLYALLDRQGELVVRQLDDHRLVHRIAAEPVGEGGFVDLAFSPDGLHLARVGDRMRPQIWRVESGQAMLQDAPEGATAPAFSADGRYVAFVNGRNVVRVNLRTGREANRWATFGRAHDLAFHPRDQRIAVGYKNSPWVSIHDSVDGRQLARLEVGNSYHTICRWHPWGRQLAVGSTDLGVQIWDVQEQRRLSVPDLQPRGMDFLSYHPSGEWLASWAWDGSLRLWDPTTGRRAMEVLLEGELQFSRDGRWLGFIWRADDQAQLLEFMAPSEYFTLQHAAGTLRLAHNALSLDRQDRLLAVAMGDGVRVWDSRERIELGLLPSGPTDGVVFEVDGRALWTSSGETGLNRWTIRQLDDDDPRPSFGSPERIELPFAPGRLSADRSVRLLAVVSEKAGQMAVVDVATKTPRILPGGHSQVSYVALSPDGRWLATSGWHSDLLRLWDASSGEQVRDRSVGTQTRVFFTPDGSELVVARGGEFEFLDARTLAPRRRMARSIGLLAGDVAFSTDGQLMAMEMAPAVIDLAEVATGRVVARLEDPFGDRSNALAFSADGTRLFVVSTHASATHVWDLRALRAGLKPMGLDWDWPELPNATGSPPNSSRASALGRPGNGGAGR